jgi:uncharacterized RDD family membrane protein YckC
MVLVKFCKNSWTVKPSNKSQKLRMNFASPIRRLYAWIIDIGLLLLAIFITAPISNGMLFSKDAAFADIAIFVVYFLIPTALRGKTIGKWVARISVVDIEGKIPGPVAIPREIVGKFVSYAVLGIGFIWIIFDKKNQSWHDKIAGTYVIEDESKSKPSFLMKIIQGKENKN